MAMERMNDARFDFVFVCLRVLSPVVLLAPVAVSACGGSETAGVNSGPKLPEGAHSETVDHEDCSDSGHRVEVLDSNGDGKPDIRRVFDKGSGHELCRVVDLNHDGKPDLYEYFDASGTVRRREFCYDDTGIVNAIEHYEGGKLARREYDAGGQHRIDTWDWFDPATPLDPKTGRPAHPARRERDTTGDGMVDQWWTWNGDKITIAVDRTGDGKPDPDTAIVLGGGDDAGTPAGGGGGGASSGPDGGAASTPPAPAVDGGAPAASAADGGKR
jgi:hypothetical protein